MADVMVDIRGRVTEDVILKRQILIDFQDDEIIFIDLIQMKDF